MIDMSFYRGTLDKEKLREFVRSTNKKILYTVGFKYRNPTTCEKPVTVEEALGIIERESLLDAREGNDYIELQAYSANDMF